MTQPNSQAVRALVLTQNDDKSVRADLRGDLTVSDLPEGNVLVRVEASSLNYKDGMAVAGRPGIVRKFPMVPGIDLAGTVLESQDERYRPGDAVLLTGWGVGEGHWGGFASHARVQGDWLTHRPEGMDAKKAMAIGTAGFTAMLAVMALEEYGLTPDSGDVVVTGAAGGVGSVAVALLAAAGWRVVASTGRAEEEEYLKSLGAAELIGRDVLSGLKRPLEKERFAAGIDSVGSTTLAGLLACLKRGGAAAACGLAGGSDLPTTVLPFILRGATLLGIDSVMCPPERRERAWERLNRELPAVLLSSGVSEYPLSEVQELAPRILAGQVRGRTVIVP
ncbi:MDR family oxidoreductase [Deinococcus ruber]|uniref:Alcohol dehydrogenase n=1 Tax=Deinococcus ruber TaxID=1848197 RepID=A0A918BUQ6_9DEIO|nr:MDR family oxidoreductase [Deinococcus ruber]GGQ93664.1 alcohol dehydrogenase [Deinococcus ruber]